MRGVSFLPAPSSPGATHRRAQRGNKDPHRYQHRQSFPAPVVPARVLPPREEDEEEEVGAKDGGDEDAEDDGDDGDVDEVVLVEVRCGEGLLDVVLEERVLGERVGRGALGSEAGEDRELVDDLGEAWGECSFSPGRVGDSLNRSRRRCQRLSSILRLLNADQLISLRSKPQIVGRGIACVRGS